MFSRNDDWFLPLPTAESRSPGVVTGSLVWNARFDARSDDDQILVSAEEGSIGFFWREKEICHLVALHGFSKLILERMQFVLATECDL